ncbi:hypothetical protein FRZ03_00505 [Streptomyces misionensis]|uniref:Uncharacterized protein n=1 Tax=Streptomyces misionensis TaxID=67331 RepID=A0A5C6K5P3_9ACTN|nr:hypothetical protein [Streptomyces misionensis]TWV58547.1 hypothetical protein FRZ03_00505 [Streptomyces misionensis]
MASYEVRSYREIARQLHTRATVIEIVNVIIGHDEAHPIGERLLEHSAHIRRLPVFAADGEEGRSTFDSLFM